MTFPKKYRQRIMANIQNQFPCQSYYTHTLHKMDGIASDIVLRQFSTFPLEGTVKKNINTDVKMFCTEKRKETIQRGEGEKKKNNN